MHETDNPSLNQKQTYPDLFEIYKNTPYLSIKHDSYFPVYEEIFKKYVGNKITFVEVGVLNGGSLFMWRKYFGEQATIIGIDLNPAAKKWEAEGFPIYIGSQSDPKFWEDFFKSVGKVDIVLDDGGHSNHQQILTADKCIPQINSGGMLVVEDVHTSYMSEFGNPSKYSFISFSKRLIDSVNSRFPAVKVVKNNYGKRVYSIAFYESIVCFHINESKCVDSTPTTNNGVSANATDSRNEDFLQKQIFAIQRLLSKKFSFIKKIRLLNYVGRMIFLLPKYLLSARKSASLKKLFK